MSRPARAVSLKRTWYWRRERHVRSSSCLARCRLCNDRHESAVPANVALDLCLLQARARLSRADTLMMQVCLSITPNPPSQEHGKHVNRQGALTPVCPTFGMLVRVAGCDTRSHAQKSLVQSRQIDLWVSVLSAPLCKNSRAPGSSLTKEKPITSQLQSKRKQTKKATENGPNTQRRFPLRISCGPLGAPRWTRRRRREDPRPRETRMLAQNADTRPNETFHTNACSENHNFTMVSVLLTYYPVDGNIPNLGDPTCHGVASKY